MKVFLLVLLCLSYLNLFSQKDTLLPYREKVLFVYLNKIRSATTDNDKKVANGKFRDYLLETILIPDAYNHPFVTLRTVGFISSPDKKFKIINWNVQLEDESNLFFCFILRPGNRKKNKVIELIEKSGYTEKLSKDIITENNWYGALYYKIIPIEKGGKDLYTILGWRSNANISNMKIIDVLNISGNHVKLGAPVFQTKTEKLKRIVYEYSKKATMSMRYEYKYDRIIFDHLSPEVPSMTGFYEYYIPDMSYDAFEFDKDKWVLKEDVIGVNDPEKQTIKQKTIDPVTGETIETEVKKQWVDPTDADAPGGKNKHLPALPKEKKR